MKIGDQGLSTRDLLSGKNAAQSAGSSSSAPVDSAEFESRLNQVKDDKAQVSAEGAALAAALAALKPEARPVTPEMSAAPAQAKSEAKTQSAPLPTQGGETLAALTQPSTLSQVPWSRGWVFDQPAPVPQGPQSAAAQGRELSTGAQFKAENSVVPQMGDPAGSPKTPVIPQGGPGRAPAEALPADAATPPEATTQLAGRTEMGLAAQLPFQVESLQTFDEAESASAPTRAQDKDGGNGTQAKKVSDFSGAEFVLTKQALNPVARNTSAENQAGTQSGSAQSGDGMALNPKAKDPRRNEAKAMPETQVIGNPTAASILSAKAAQPAPTPSAFDQKGLVVKGGMAKDRLSSEALMNLTGNIRSSTLNPEGGEIRLRLAPDNLGEVRVKISSIGNHVKLNIQATNDKAKQIMEDSLGYLREAMNSNQLTLTKVDIGLAQPSQSHNLGQQSQFQQDGSQAWSQQAMNLQQGQDGGSRGRSYQEMAEERELGGVTGVNSARGGLKNAGLGAIPSGLSSMSGARAAGGLSSQQRIDIRV